MADGWDLGRQSVLPGTKGAGTPVGEAFTPAKQRYAVETTIGRRRSAGAGWGRSSSPPTRTCVARSR